MSQLQIVDRGTVYMADAGSPHASAAFADCHVTEAGRWLVTFRTAPGKTDRQPEHVRITWSDDEGATWSEPIAPFAAPAIGDRPGVFRRGNLGDLGDGRIGATLMWVDHANPDLPFFNEETEGLLLTRPFLSVSHDGGETWEAPRLLDPAPFTCATPTTGPILVNHQGEWLLQFETQKTYNDTGPWLQRAVMMRSTDDGRTWPTHSDVAHDPDGRIFHWDMRAKVLRDGTVIAAFWTFDRDAAVYRHIHITKSTDGGHTWAEPWDSGLPGQPAPIVDAGDGDLAIAYVDREGIPQIKARLSSDGGHTWPDSTELVVARADQPQQNQKASMQDAWTEMHAFSLGLPETTLLPGGDILLTWYQGPTTDHTGIHWARLRAAR